MSIHAQVETDCPFAPRKYVHYDGIIESESTQIPINYNQLVQNDSAYKRGAKYLKSAAKADCFFKTSIHNDGLIKKPFVFVEGISFEKNGANSNLYTLADYFRQDWYPSPPINQIESYECYFSSPQHLGVNVGYSTFNWATLVTGIDAEGYVDGDPLKVEKAPELLNQLCCAGYDICFIDFASGEAYIESNGEALYSILVKLHQQLVDNNSNEKMVVCGASMGGLVARYAINKLEAEGHIDWVEKFISFDSPQMGANIPLGVQYTLKHLKKLNSDLKIKYSKLTCPSASQLVNYSCLETNLTSPIVYTTPVPSIERSLFLLNPYMGWPQYCTKVAISNGSRLGAPQSTLHQPGDKVLDIDGLVDLDIYSLPQNDNSYNKVFDFDPPYCMLQNPVLLASGLAMQQSIRVQNTMALDLAPGSYRKDLTLVKNSVSDAITSTVGQVLNNCSLGWTDNSTNNDNLCFIPLMSSIGAINYENIMKSNNAVSQSLLTAAFNGTDKFEDYSHQFSNFDVVYAPSSNQSHVEITDENISWVMHELTDWEDAVWHENKFLTTKTYKGRNEVRAGNNIFGNPVCDQAPNPGGGLMSGNNGNMQAQALHCGDVIIASNHVVHYKSANFVSLEPGFYTQDNATFQAEIVPLPVCYSSARTALSTGANQANYSSSPNQFAFVSKDKPKDQGLSMQVNSIHLFPNPANNYIEINSMETISQIDIRSIMGALVSSNQINQNNYRINTNEMANGVYLVSVKTNNETVVKKVVVKHE
jgi:hypothetical protein